MDASPSSILPSHKHLIIFISFFLFTTSSYSSDHHERYTACSGPFRCGNLENISYPFWGGTRPLSCGRQGFELLCPSSPTQSPRIMMDALEFFVLGIDEDAYTMRIARSDLWRTSCPQNLINTTLNYSHFDYIHTADRNLSVFYNCNGELNLTDNWRKFPCRRKDNGSSFNSLFTDDDFVAEYHQRISKCNMFIVVPLLKVVDDNLMGSKIGLEEALVQGFDIHYRKYQAECQSCINSGGICGSEVESAGIQFACFCPGRIDPIGCESKPESRRTLWLALTIGIAAAVFGLLVLFVTCYQNDRKVRRIQLRKEKTKNELDLEEFIRGNEPLPLRRYNYQDIKKMTYSLRDKLGHGGYGGVYKGKLPDGSLVAVKILNPSRRNGEEFVNEVVSMSRTSHINIATLLGYCLDRKRRALVYEFMPSGSLDAFIYRNSPSTASQQLEWAKLFQIAVGIARGLEYLHRGCKTKILHLDIKPHNILLDENFCPKISDFGLAKLCSEDESFVSMQEARGTIGYIAPEIFSRNFGEVSTKADVYSYGMMILEMVGRRENIKVGVSCTSEIYFPEWIYHQLKLGEDLGFPDDIRTEEDEMARKMILVGLWCIQTAPTDRPSISKVIDMLEGSTEALQIPPKPFISSLLESPESVLSGSISRFCNS